MKKFKVESGVWELLPKLRIGVLVLDVSKSNDSMTCEKLSEIENILKDANVTAHKYVPNETISENEVVKIWRETYRKFPTKKGARCSVENLLKRVLHDNPVGTINPSVDITNAISLKYALPIGAEDLDKIEGDLRLTIMNGDERFSLIGEEEDNKPLAGEVAYRDDEGVVCRSLNWRDGERTKVDENTRHEFIAMECVDESRYEELETAIDELAKVMNKYLDAEIITKNIVSIDNKEICLS